MKQEHADLMKRLFNLNDKDVLVYEAFLTGCKTAKSISDKLKSIPQNKVYQHIKRLHDASLIRQQKTGYSRSYILVNPKKTIQGEISILGDKSEPVAEELEELFNKLDAGVEEPKNDALVVQDNGIQIELKELIGCAEREVCGIGHHFKWIKTTSWMRTLEGLRKSDVKVKMIALDDEDTRNNMSHLASIGKLMEVKVVRPDLIKKGFIVIDNQIVVCSLAIDKEETTKAIVIKDSAFAGFFHDKFEQLWEHGKPLEEK